MTNLLEMTKTTGRSLRLVIVAALFVGLARADGGGALGWPTLGRVLRCGDDGEFAALVLRRQSWLGDGLRMGVGARWCACTWVCLCGLNWPEPARGMAR